MHGDCRPNTYWWPSQSTFCADEEFEKIATNKMRRPQSQYARIGQPKDDRGARYRTQLEVFLDRHHFLGFPSSA